MNDEMPRLTQEQYNQIIRDYQKLMGDIGENTRLTKDVHRILVGEPEYKRKGLVEIVDWHDTLIKRVGGAVIVIGILWKTLELTLFRKG